MTETSSAAMERHVTISLRRLVVRDAVKGIAPEVLWRYFDMISQIPRGSGNEAAIQTALENLAKEKGLAARRDAVGNLVVVIPATAGCASSPTVVLQGHTDMVCEKNNDSNHNFEKDPIDLVRNGDWLTAKGTTLGADNGVAVAAALALTDDPPEKHGKLELLFTVDEERGLTGAGGIESHMLTGKIMLNLDSEEEGFVTIGCAGGGDTRIRVRCVKGELPAGWETMKVSITGLKGGHSGIDIHENRGNSLRLMGRFLDRVRTEAGGLRIFSLGGGSKRNAIPREAFCELAVPAGGRAKAEGVRGIVAGELKVEFGATDPKLEVLLGEVSGSGKPFTKDTTDKLVALLLTIPTGVIAMNRKIVGLVDTSTNLGVVEANGDVLEFVSCSRSSIGSALEAVRESLRVLGESVGVEAVLEGSYPGWNPNLESPLLATFKNVHKRVTGSDVKVMAIHAGLECGLLGKKFPGMDMISIGPDMDGVHSPDERLSISSTERFYHLLKATLVELA